MERLWKYAENTFEVVTRTSFKLMHIIITDHASRCQQLSAADPLNQTLIDAQQDATLALTSWQTEYTKWINCRALYKGATQHFYELLETLASLRIRQWDAGIQAVYLEGTAPYTTLLPQGRAPFQKGALDTRVEAVRALSLGLAAHPALAILKGQVDAELALLDAARNTQQQRETEVDTCSADLEVRRVSVAAYMYRNLGRFMQLYWQNPVKIEDAWDMNYIRDGAAPPPEDEPPPPPPAPPVP